MPNVLVNSARSPAPVYGQLSHWAAKRGREVCRAHTLARGNVRRVLDAAGPRRETTAANTRVQAVAQLPAGAEPGLAPTDGPTSSPFVGSQYVTFPTRHLPQTTMGWEVNPAGLRKLLVRLGQEYDNLPPLFVTENGAAYDDRISDDGRVHDVERTAYIVDHIGAVKDAIADGADIRGYFVWSLLDNFEWAYGYSKRFGIVRVDYESQVRTIKDSGREYARIIASAKRPILTDSRNDQLHG